MCVLVETPDISLLIDPGAAIMQPRYPAPQELKLHYLELATRALRLAAARATHVAITHYHYDHFRPDLPDLFRGKVLWIKDPNRWINRSQWGRARDFLRGIAALEGRALGETSAPKEEYPDPLDELPLSEPFRPRRDLLRRWRRRFRGLVRLWQQGPWVDPCGFGDRVVFADGRVFRIGETLVRFSAPLFHGTEYAGPGWVLGVTVEYGGKKLLFSSDLQGPVIEDYAAWIREEGPDYLVLDGPATYLRGPLQSRETLDRAIRNCAAAVAGAKEVAIVDHHLTREPRFKEACREAFAAGAITGAEALGYTPLTERLGSWRSRGELGEVISQAQAGELDRELLERILKVTL